MNSFVIFDSNYGNTQKVAEVIAAELGARVANIATLKPVDLSGLDFLVVGTPIIGWMPTVKMQEFLGKLKEGQLKGVKATTFDTRVKLFIHGDAMGKVADSLKGLGAEIVSAPTPFYVAGKQDSPHLLEGELEKAKSWGKKLKEII